MSRPRPDRPRLLDLFCCAGGIAKGYHDAGFEVVGVDIEPQPNYPFDFLRADALDVLCALISGGSIWMSAAPGRRHAGRWYRLGDFAAIHASPPCQARSDLQRQSGIHYEEFVGRTRDLLLRTGRPYVIENVEGAARTPDDELRDPVLLCGTMFAGLRVLRHRLFESNFPITQPPHGRHPLVFTHDKRKAHYGKLDQDTSFVQVTGGGNCTVANKRAAMGVPWMTGAEANEAIPPAYAEYVGMALLASIALPVAA